MASAAALELDDVSAGYGETVVLEDIRLALGEGETLSIIGRNGVGKTTLLATVMGHNTLHGGDVRLHGRTIARLPPHRRNWAGLGYVPQEREVFPSLTLRENLEVAARPGAWTIDKVFGLFPRLVLMDEPSEGLAPVIVEELARAVKRLAATEGLTMILVEQNTRLALDISPRTAVMDRGRIVFDGPSEELKRDPDRLHRLIGVGKG
jgi:branched-chain amino acid transport system ATP-binding protein